MGSSSSPVQHHYAHVAGLMAEHNVDEIVGICCDGYGYGDDGSAWGGEIIFANRSEHRRVGHLEPQPMVGGDLATKYPLRMVAGILRNHVEIREWLIERREHFPRGGEEIETVVKQLHSSRIPMTTSCGRVLDAVSSILGLCYERSYEGEAAMKLESAAQGGRDSLEIEPTMEGEVIRTSEIVHEIFANVDRLPVRDLAFSAQSCMARSLAVGAIAAASRLGVRTIGFTGGVACNEMITRILGDKIEQAGFRFLVHQAVPPGDGGLSFGQAVVAVQSLQQ